MHYLLFDGLNARYSRMNQTKIVVFHDLYYDKQKNNCIQRKMLRR